jgi:putative redox protein
MRMEIVFPGGSTVDARFAGHTVHTDQPVKSGGAGTAPSPFDLFLASVGTCAGLFALQFCQRRQIDTEGLALALSTERGEGELVSTLRLELTLPPGFPAKYRDAILRAIDQCTVKRHLQQAPAFDVRLVDSVS